MTHPKRPPGPEDTTELETDVAVLIHHPEHGWMVQYGRGRVVIASSRDEMPSVYDRLRFPSDLSWGEPTHLTGVEWVRPTDDREPIYRMRWWDGAAPMRPSERIVPAPRQLPAPAVVTLADGTRLGEVDPNGTPVEWRISGSVDWQPAIAIRAFALHGVDTVEVETRYPNGTVVQSISARYVRRPKP